MKAIKLVCLAVLALLLPLPPNVYSADEIAGKALDQDADQAKSKLRPPKVLMGTPPVNTNMSASGSLPQGMLFTKLNASFSDKIYGTHDYNGSKVMSQSWLMKVRYGLTNWLELSTVFPYINNSRHDPTPPQRYVEGIADQVLGFNIAPYNLHQGDPFSLSFVVAAVLPTAHMGRHHLPGVGAWGWRANIAAGTMITPNLKIDTEIMGTGPFTRGNNDIQRGNEYQWNTQLRYIFQHFDIGLESSLVWQMSGNREVWMGPIRGKSNVDLNNGSTTWWLGPSVNVALPFDMWAGAGVYLPVYRDTYGPQAVEGVRFDFSIGKLF
jgi:hypothetical protein